MFSVKIHLLTWDFFLCKFGNHPDDDNIDWLCLNNFRRRYDVTWRKRGMMILRITMTKLLDKRKFSSIRSVYPVQLCTVPLFVFLYLISSICICICPTICILISYIFLYSTQSRLVYPEQLCNQSLQGRRGWSKRISSQAAITKTNTQTQKDKYTKTLVMIKEALILIQVALRYDMMASKIAHSLAIVK